MIHVGIDLHSRNMTLVAVNDNGDLICEVKTESNPVGLERFFQRFNQPVQAVVECTSYWYWVADWCNQHEIATGSCQDAQSHQLCKGKN